jgi:AcrR family transcriptional regulator
MKTKRKRKPLPRRAPKDELLKLGLASGMTIEEAAAQANLSRSTAHRRLRKPEFSQAVATLQDEMTERVAGGSYAAIQLVRLLHDESPTVRLTAARAILAQLLAYREGTGILRRLKMLEARLNQTAANDAPSPADAPTLAAANNDWDSWSPAILPPRPDLGDKR